MSLPVSRAEQIGIASEQPTAALPTKDGQSVAGCGSLPPPSGGVATTVSLLHMKARSPGDFDSPGRRLSRRTSRAAAGLRPQRRGELVLAHGRPARNEEDDVIRHETEDELRHRPDRVAAIHVDTRLADLFFVASSRVAPSPHRVPNV